MDQIYKQYMCRLIYLNIVCVLLNSFLLQLSHALSQADLFFLSDAELFQLGIDQFRNGVNTNQLGNCIISDDSHACSHYVSACSDGQCLGLPDLIGTGCLGLGCWGPPNTYTNYQSSKLPICSGNIIQDGANMLRIGILKGFCGKYSQVSNKNESQIKTEEAVNSNLKATSISNFPQWLFWLSWGTTFILLLIVIILSCFLFHKRGCNMANKSLQQSKEGLKFQSTIIPKWN